MWEGSCNIYPTKDMNPKYVVIKNKKKANNPKEKWATLKQAGYKTR